MSPREIRLWVEPLIEKTRALLGAENQAIRYENFIGGLIILGMVNVMQGMYNPSFSLFEEAARLARETGENRLLAASLTLKNGFQIFRLHAEIQELEEAVAICRKNHFPVQLFWALE